MKHGMWVVMVGMLATGTMPGWSETRSLADIKAGRRVTDAASTVDGQEAAGTNAAAGAVKSDVNVPAGWLRGPGPSGYERAVELQQASGKDMLVYFFREDPADEKGLCHWFEKKGMNESHVLKEMRKYIKVRIDAAQNDSRTRALVDEYRCGKTPRLVVRRPDGYTKRVEVFTWPEGGGQPNLVPPVDVVKNLQEAGTPATEPVKEE